MTTHSGGNPAHTVAYLRFPLSHTGKPAHLACSCGFATTVLPNRSLAEPWATVEDAWRLHRRSVGAGTAAATGDHQHGSSYPFGRTALVPERPFNTALGQTRLSPAERGRMGQAAKRAKAKVRP